MEGFKVNDPSTHLSSEALQAYLEGELAAERTEKVEAHLAGCSRCASELDGWRLVFSQLDELPGLEPSENFAERVMAEVPTRPSLGRRLMGTLRTAMGRRIRNAEEHLGPDRLQELLDGALGQGDRRRAHAHMEACPACQSEFQEWQTVFTSLGSLPRLAPSEGFARRVMTAFQASASPAPTPGVLDRALQWAGAMTNQAGRLLPSTPRGWTGLGAIASLPALGVLALMGAVTAHPLLTLGGLATFLSWRVADGFQAAMAWGSQWLADSAVAGALWEAASAASASPSLAVAGLMALWALTLASAWILYRNVIAPSPVTGRHA